ncbi:ferredoxin [bacterium F16]|nr:ferredoxin [bacterium F16]
MKATVDPDYCTGCGVCVDICPDVFHMPENLAIASETIPADYEDDCQEACDQCPVEAIQIEK